MDKKLIVDLMRWIARILGTILALIIVWFFLGNVFTDGWPTGLGITETVMFGGLFLMVCGMVVFWFNEFWAGIITITGFLVFSITNMVGSGNFFTGTFTLIFLIIGLLFLIVWFLDRNIKKGEK